MALRQRNEQSSLSISVSASVSSVSSSSSGSSLRSSSRGSLPASEPLSSVAAAAASAASAYYYQYQDAAPSSSLSPLSHYDDSDYNDDNEGRRPQPQQLTSTSAPTAQSFLLLLLALTFVPALLIPSSRYRSLNADISAMHTSYSQDRARLDNLRAELEGARIRAHELGDDVRRAEGRREALVLGLHDAAAEAEQKKQKTGSQRRRLTQKDREDVATITDLDHLRHAVRTRASIHVQNRYGPGPHRLKFDVRFLGPQGKPTDDPTDLTSFVIELASMEAMPHTVHHFLTSALELHLWDGTAFVHHDDARGVTAVPTDYRTARSVGHRFEQSGMDELAVSEGTSDALKATAMQSMESYLVCYGGGGAAEFYIKLDGDDDFLRRSSSSSHPNGRRRSGNSRGNDDDTGSHDDDEDPCFGRVVRGQDVVDRIAQRHLTGAERRRINVVGIEGATFLPKAQQSSGTSNSETEETSKNKSRQQQQGKQKQQPQVEIEWSMGRMAVGPDGMPL